MRQEHEPPASQLVRGAAQSTLSSPPAAKWHRQGKAERERSIWKSEGCSLTAARAPGQGQSSEDSWWGPSGQHWLHGLKAPHIQALLSCSLQPLTLMLPQDSLQKEQFSPPQIFPERNLLQSPCSWMWWLWAVAGSTSGRYSSVFMPVLWKWHLPIPFTGLWRRLIRRLRYPAFCNLPN